MWDSQGKVHPWAHHWIVPPLASKSLEQKLSPQKGVEKTTRLHDTKHQPAESNGRSYPWHDESADPAFPRKGIPRR